MLSFLFSNYPIRKTAIGIVIKDSAIVIIAVRAARVSSNPY
jgi:hypothetical protein